jgi:hypothetical protein
MLWLKLQTEAQQMHYIFLNQQIIYDEVLSGYQPGQMVKQ